MVWWIWLLLGLALLALEIVTPSGFYIFFFGIGAIVTGVVVDAGLGGPPWLQWLFFSFFSIASAYLLRHRLSRTFSAHSAQRDADPGALIGESAVLLGDLRSGGVGRAEIRGTSWTVRAREPRDLPSGTYCIVENVDGATLWVRAEQGGTVHA